MGLDMYIFGFEDSMKLSEGNADEKELAYWRKHPRSSWIHCQYICRWCG